MLKIINVLEPFFEDCYRRIGVREYAKLSGMSPPTASKTLGSLHNKGILNRETYRNYILFYANKESRDFIDLSRIYWRHRLDGVVSFMEKELVSPGIILFGSLSKAETRPESDIDLAVFAHKKEMDMKAFEKKLKRKIQLFWFRSLHDKSKELSRNVINGYVLAGRMI